MSIKTDSIRSWLELRELISNIILTFEQRRLWSGWNEREKKEKRGKIAIKIDTNGSQSREAAQKECVEALSHGCVCALTVTHARLKEWPCVISTGYPAVAGTLQLLCSTSMRIENPIHGAAQTHTHTHYSSSGTKTDFSVLIKSLTGLSSHSKWRNL